MSSTLSNLEIFLNNTHIPRVKKQPKTFLGIAKQPHYENVLSNILAFYFNVGEAHKLGDLFIVSLLELVTEKFGENIKDFDGFSDFQVQTETTTNKGGRIDLLLYNDDHCIIIENKVYHTLGNDLDDYYNSQIKKYNKNNIAGVVLSLFPISFITHPEFINITHKQLLTRVMKNIGGYLLEADTTYIVFLKDLYQNTLNLSTKQMKPEDIQFYKEHRDNIHQTARFLNRFKDHVKREIEATCGILNGDVEYLNLKGTTSNRLRYYESKANPDLMFTIGFDRLYIDNHKDIWIVVELKGDALLDRSIYNQIDFSAAEKQLINNNFYSDNKTGWAHFAFKSYPYELIDFNDLRNFIVQNIEGTPLLSIFNKLNAFLTNRNN